MDHHYSWEGFKEVALDIRAKNFFQANSESSIIIESNILIVKNNFNKKK